MDEENDTYRPGRRHWYSLHVFIEGERVLFREEDHRFEDYDLLRDMKTVTVATGTALAFADIPALLFQGKHPPLYNLLVRPVAAREYEDPLCHLLVVEADLDYQEMTEEEAVAYSKEQASVLGAALGVSSWDDAPTASPIEDMMRVLGHGRKHEVHGGEHGASFTPRPHDDDPMAQLDSDTPREHMTAHPGNYQHEKGCPHLN